MVDVSYIEARIEDFLAEDLGFGDLTTEALVGDEVQAEAVIVSKAGGVVAGLSEACCVFSRLGCKVESLKRDGETIGKGERLLSVSGPAASILKGERLALNLMMRMSGISTLTSQFVEKCRKVNGRTRIACTRKTVPGFRVFDKKAVQLGGGDTHRFRLDDALLIKENHLRIVGSVAEAVRRAKNKGSFMKKVEVEVSGLRNAVIAIKAGADIVMLDNLSAREVREIVRWLEEAGLRNRTVLEASGNIRLENVASYARTGVDVLSVGELTHSVKALDMSLEVVKVNRRREVHTTS